MGGIFYIQGLDVPVGDTGGMGDTKGQDDIFADDVASYMRSIGGFHGIFHAHNACSSRLGQQARKALNGMGKTLIITNKDTMKALAWRLFILFTQCADTILSHIEHTQISLTSLIN